MSDNRKYQFVPVIFGVSGDSNKLCWLLHSIKELIVIILVTGIGFP